MKDGRDQAVMRNKPTHSIALAEKTQATASFLKLYTLFYFQVYKFAPTMWEAWVRSLGWEDPLEEGMVTHSSILVWRIPMDRPPDAKS